MCDGWYEDTRARLDKLNASDAGLCLLIAKNFRVRMRKIPKIQRVVDCDPRMAYLSKKPQGCGKLRVVVLLKYLIRDIMNLDSLERRPCSR